MKKHYILLSLLLLVGCATFVAENLNEIFGQQNPARFDAPTPPRGAMSFRQDVQPILNQRCVVCHACYDAPCQLKLGAWEGVARGASAEEVYATRLFEAAPSRLFIDADKPSEWRKRGFFPVLNEYAPNPVAEQHASLLARSIEHKARHPVEPNELISGEMDFSLDRAHQCTSIQGYQDYERRNPQNGMPFGLPGLSIQETDTIKRWLRLGAPYEGPEQPSATTLRQIAEWEVFLNGNEIRAQLVNRYIYEHLFLAHLYFYNESKPQYLRLVRSSTPPGTPVREIASRRPFDDPGVARAYYRFVQERESISAKTHMPYALSAARMARWKSLFYDAAYSVERLPDYTPALAANPFETFRDLPVQARYEFMLDEAQFTIMGFIKGPVCRGQTALNVINDHFWVFFQAPSTTTPDDIGFINGESRNLAMLTIRDAGAPIALPWARHRREQIKFLENKSAYLENRYDTPDKMGLNFIWSGAGVNPNAGLTIYRNFDNASVLKGLVGELPKTAWVIGYPLLERIHYLLVASYDVYGGVNHQLNTRLYMDSLRMEGEFNFLTLLPKASRIAVRDHWYRGADEDIKDQVYGKVAQFNRESGIQVPNSKRPEHALMEILKAHIGKAAPSHFDIAKMNDIGLQRDLRALASIKGKPLTLMPHSAILRIEEPGKAPRTLTLLHITAHRNLTLMFDEQKSLIPEEDALDVLTGIATAHPNAFYRIQRKDLAAFTNQIRALETEGDYHALTARFGVRRTSPVFWALSDAIHAEYAASSPIEAGLLDYNRLENR